jgi:hypothetical protein
MNFDIKSAVGCAAATALGAIMFAGNISSANADTPRSVPASFVGISHSVISSPKRELDAVPAGNAFLAGSRPSAYLEWDDLPSYLYAEWNDWSVPNNADARLPPAVKVTHSPALLKGPADKTERSFFRDTLAYTYLEWNGW